MRLSLRRPRLLAAALVSTAVVAVVPAVAGAQSLQSVAIATDSSSGFLVLDVSGGSTANGAKVIQWYGSGAANQRWNFVERADGGQSIVNQKSGKCLTSDGVAGHQLYQFTCTGSTLQKWVGSIGTNTSGTLVNAGANLIMDVNGASASAGAAIIGWHYSGAANQLFSYYQLW